MMLVVIREATSEGEEEEKGEKVRQLKKMLIT